MPLDKVPESMQEGSSPGSVLTAKGDLLGHDGSDVVRVAGGDEGHVLRRRDAAASGLAWETLPEGGGGLPIGAILAFAHAAPPSGFLPCDGAAVARSTYADLFSAIGETWGSGNGVTTFNVPDLRSVLLIGAGTGSTAWSIDAVSTGSDTLTLGGHPAPETGTRLLYTSSGTVATPLVSGQYYYACRVSSTQIKLQTTRALAIAYHQTGVAIHLSAAGTGTQRLTMELSARTLATKIGEETHALLVAELPAHQHSVRAETVIARPSGFGVAEHAHADGGLTGAAGGSAAHPNMPPAAVVAYYIYAGA